MEKRLAKIHIRRMSWLVKWGAYLGFALTTVSAVFNGLTMHLSTSQTASFGVGEGDRALGTLDWFARCPYYVAVAIAFFMAGRLFHSLSKGNIFTHQTISQLKFFTFSVVAASIHNIFYGLYSALLKWMFGETADLDIFIDVDGSDLSGLILSGMLIIFAMIYQEAQRQSEDIRLIF